MSAATATTAVVVLGYGCECHRAIWRHEQRGGYAFVEHVPVVVVRKTAKRVTIRAMRKTGEMVDRSVTPEHVIAPNTEQLQAHASIYQAIEVSL